MAQVAAFSSDDHLRVEAARWRDVAPSERVAETWRLCGILPWLSALWSPEVRARAGRPEPLARDAVEILERMKAGSRTA